VKSLTPVSIHSHLSLDRLMPSVDAFGQASPEAAKQRSEATGFA
jgi:hypothetical protein